MAVIVVPIFVCHFHWKWEQLVLFCFCKPRPYSLSYTACRQPVHKQIYDSIKQNMTNFVDKTKQACCSAIIQSSTTCKQLFQNVNTILGQKYFFASSFSVWLWRPPKCLFWLFHRENPHHQKQFFSDKPNCLSWYLSRWKSLANFRACHWQKNYLKNNHQCTGQVLRMDPIPRSGVCCLEACTTSLPSRMNTAASRTTGQCP